jgi:hypothetical protein
VDPFANEWPGIIEILMANRDVGAKSILELLISESPEKFNWTHLRTLQRGVRRWRQIEASVVKPAIVPGSQLATDNSAILYRLHSFFANAPK